MSITLKIYSGKALSGTTQTVEAEIAWKAQKLLYCDPPEAIAQAISEHGPFLAFEVDDGVCRFYGCFFLDLKNPSVIEFDNVGASQEEPLLWGA